MIYRRIGKICSFDEIPWGNEIIIVGSLGNGWYWRSEGVFIKDERGYRFRDHCGVYTDFMPNDFISLGVMEKYIPERGGAEEGSITQPRSVSDEIDFEKRIKILREATNEQTI